MALPGPPVRRLIVLLLLALATRAQQRQCGARAGLQDSLSRAREAPIDAAIECMKATMQDFPESGEAYVLFAERLKAAGRGKQAAEVLQSLLPRVPAGGRATVLTLIAQLWEAVGSEKDAQRHYEAACEAVPGTHVVWYNLGYFHMTRYDFDRALPAFLRSVEANDQFGKGHEGVGAIYFGQGEEERALPHLRKAALLMPDEMTARLNLANCLGKLERAVESVAAFKEVLKLDPDHKDAINKLAYFALQCCDWSDYNTNFKRVMHVLKEQLSAGEQTSLIPFNALIFPIGIHDQLRIAQSHASRHKGVEPLAKKASSRKSGPLRVGYLSADFRDHPMGRDLSVLLLAHTKSATEAHCYAQNPPHEVHDGVYRQKMIQGVEDFHEINHLSDADAAALIHSHSIDVLVDLMGYTHGARDGVLALQPAPVQIAFKGYMSTTGSKAISHLVSDAPTVPIELTGFYSERQLYLRPCFVASTHAINHPEALGTRLGEVLGENSRRAAGLPQEGFIFACFNSLYKISPSLFDAWLKILKGVPGSYLWLLRAPAEAEACLCKHATKRGVSCKRLIFTDKVEMKRHLLVKSNAQLFLDTPMYNAHSTAADALWAAVPIVTLPREKMAARVGASLVMSLGLPELVVRNLDEYVSLATTLAKRPTVLSALREKLKRRRTDPEHNGMFDVGRWMRAYESGIRMAHELAVVQGKGKRSHVIVTS